MKLAAVAGAWLVPRPLPAACRVAVLRALLAIGLQTVISTGEPLLADLVVPFGAFTATVILVFWI